MFDFYFPHILYQNTSSWWEGLIATLIGTFVGAGLGFLGALRLQKNQEKNIVYNKLNMFSILTDDVLSVVRKEIDEFKNLIEKIKKEPYEYHLPKKFASSDLERIHYLLKSEIFSPLAFILGSQSNDYYKNCRKAIDFIYLTSNLLTDMNKKHIDFTYNDQCFIRDSVDDIMNIIIKRIELIRTTYSEFENDNEYVYLLGLDSTLKRLRKESEEKNNSNLEGYKVHFLEEILKNGLSIIEQKDLFEIIAKAKPALNRLEKIKINSLQFSEDCESYCNQINDQLPQLETFNETLKEKLKTKVDKKKKE